MAGTGEGFDGDGGPATAALLGRPYGVVVDGAGNLFVADTDNNRVRRVAAGTGRIETVAGNGSFTYSGDGGAAAASELANPTGLEVDADGNLLIAAAGNHGLRAIKDVAVPRGN